MKNTVFTATLSIMILTGVSVFGQSKGATTTINVQRSGLTELQNQARLQSTQIQQSNQARSVLGQDSKYQGGVATGGGDFASQEVRAIVTQLPNILRSKGLQYFPEVNIDDIEELSRAEVLVEINNDIRVNDAPKNLKFDRNRISIQVDANLWMNLKDSPDVELKKQAIVFHEVLGLLGLEKNNDYTISNRLLGIGYLSALNIASATNQIFPKDFQDQQIIYWKENQNGRITFFYCQNRMQISTCKLLGLRSYTKAEINEYLVKTKAEFDKSANKATFVKNLGKTGMVLVVAAVAGAFVAPAVVVAAGLTAPVAAVSLLGSFFVYGGGVTIEDSYNRQRLDTFGPATQIMSGKSGPADQLGRITSFEDYAQSFHNFLIQLDHTSTKQGAKLN